jgi:hypothetical protein
MEDSVDPCSRALHGRGIEDGAEMERQSRRARQVLIAAGGEIIKNADVIPLIEKPGHEVAPDEPAAASH